MRWHRLTAMPQLLLAVMGAIASVTVEAKCRSIDSPNSLQISPLALKDVGGIGFGQAEIMAAIKDVSVPETRGCWAGATGNFDGEILSVGFAQWNFGQGSLQPLLLAFRRKYDHRQFNARLDELAPKYGKVIFSDGCLRPKITAECSDRLLALQVGRAGHRLNADFEEETNRLFEDDVMVQVQVDRFLALLTSVKSDLQRLFPNQRPTPRQVKWAIDTKVQQGHFPGNTDVTRIREAQGRLDGPGRKEKLLGLVKWYEGLADSVDQGGVRHDWKWNVEKWRQVIQNKEVTEEQLDLLHLTFLRSRVANGEAGLWQALTFQRRATIIFGVGSIAGRRLGA
ncbi:MAG: hypothetical protein Q8K71_17460 [Polaromonas sp.]|nr:hypothetical protein [Polaromonas sp.]MDP3752126.1 hypothetical protein [Polaromonas sp.]